MADAAAGTSVAPFRRRLIVCCDGTTNDGINTTNPLANVARISRCVKSEDDRDPHDRVVQIVYYQTGVGTGTSQLGNVVDSIYGRGLNSNIRGAYTFLCQNYSSERDEIILVGFSRGAFTARALAQFVNDIGILRKSGLEYLRRIFNLWKAQYLDSTKPSASESERKATLHRTLSSLEAAERLHRQVAIQACAVWDTVAALSRHKLGFVGESIPDNVKLALQALALDEERAQFSPLLWRRNPLLPNSQQSLKQCWFLGTHSDIGGGTKGIDLANISLAWMIAHLRERVAFSDGLVNRITDTDGASAEDPASVASAREHGEGNYRIDFEVATADLQSKSNIKVGPSAKIQRLSGWALRRPFTAGRSAHEQLHWSVRPLLDKRVVRGSKAYARACALGREILQTKPTSYERNMLRVWVARQCLKVFEDGFLKPVSATSKTKAPRHLVDFEMPLIASIPVYAVLWDPSQWTLNYSRPVPSNVQITITGGLKVTQSSKPEHSTMGNAISYRVSLPIPPGIFSRHHALSEAFQVLQGSVTIPYISSVDLLKEAYTLHDLQHLEDPVPTASVSVSKYDRAGRSNRWAKQATIEYDIGEIDVGSLWQRQPAAIDEVTL